MATSHSLTSPSFSLSLFPPLLDESEEEEEDSDEEVEEGKEHQDPLKVPLTMADLTLSSSPPLSLPLSSHLASSPLPSPSSLSPLPSPSLPLRASTLSLSSSGGSFGDLPDSPSIRYSKTAEKRREVEEKIRKRTSSLEAAFSKGARDLPLNYSDEEYEAAISGDPSKVKPFPFLSFPFLSFLFPFPFPFPLILFQFYSWNSLLTLPFDFPGTF